jgi:hypothetical protein
MTATTLTYLVSQEHINDLMREAESSRRAAEVGSTRRVRLAVSRVFTRRVPRTAMA